MQLLHDLERFILPENTFELDTEWSGIMAFGNKKLPLIETKGNHIAMGVRLGGMGVAIGSKIGEATAQLLFD